MERKTDGKGNFNVPDSFFSDPAGLLFLSGLQKMVNLL